MKFIQEIVKYIKDDETGMGLDLEEPKVLIYFTNKNKIDELFLTVAEDITIISEEINQYSDFSNKHINLKLIGAKNIFDAKLDNNSFDCIITDSGILNTDQNVIRNELKRISANGWSDIKILDENKLITEDFLKFFYAGSGYETKVFSHEGENELIIYHNPIGFNEEELRAKEITEFIKACEIYCDIIENYSKYTIKDFLYNIQKALVNYYMKGFDLPSCSGSDNNELSGHDFLQDKQNFSKNFKSSLPLLQNFLGIHCQYWSNFSPYPDETDDKNPYWHSLALDLDDMYEDIKSNLLAFKTNNIYNQQQALWDFKFDWKGHTGDHWTFAVRAIHWKLAELRFDD